MRHRGFAHGWLGLAVATLAIIPPGHAQDAAPANAPVATPVAGEYVHSEMELVAAIRLNTDGSFQYGLTVGALDESAQGRWKAVGDRIELTSEPRPVPPTITAGPVEAARGKPFALRVLTPAGHDMPGVDLRIEFDTGAPLESYMAGGPWSLPTEERRVPRFVTFSMPAYRLKSAPLPLEARTGRIATFVLTPNDFGVLDLTGAHAEIAGDMLTLHRPEGVMAFKRTRR